VALALAQLVGCGSIDRRGDGGGQHGDSRAASQIIYVVRRGWHVEVAFEAEQIQPPLTAVLARFPGARFLSVGFGDRRYLMVRNKSSPSLLLALWPGAGLMLVTGLSAPPQRAFGSQNVIEIRLTPDGMRAAQAFVADTIFFRDGQPQVESQTPYEGGLYLASTRRYSAANTCNTWVARTLQAAGLPVHSTGVAFAGQIWSQARRIAKDQARVAMSVAGRLGAVLANHRGL
jgi:Protein of unknown function (DUF2459)